MGYKNSSASSNIKGSACAADPWNSQQSKMATPMLHELKEVTVLTGHFTQDFIRVTTYKNERKKTELIQEKKSLARMAKIFEIKITR